MTRVQLGLTPVTLRQTGKGVKSESVCADECNCDASPAVGDSTQPVATWLVSGHIPVLKQGC